MVESKHTKGPWEYREIAPYNDGIGYISADGHDILHAGVSDLPADENRANGNLIAVAPELLEALMGAVAAWEKFYPLLPVRADVEDAEFDEFQKARTAICKVHGLQSWDYHKAFGSSTLSGE